MKRCRVCSPRGGKSEAHRAPRVSKGKSIGANVSVAAELTKTGSPGNSVADTNADAATEGAKRLVEIPLKTVFLHVVHSLGIPEPVFIDVEFRGSFQVHIEIKSHQSCALLPKCIFATIAGDVASSYELAEASAIRNSFAHLGSTANIAVVDLSSYKILRTKQECRWKYKNILEATRCVDNVIIQWRLCCSYLYDLEKLASNELQAEGGNCTSDIRVSFLRKFRTLVLHLASQSADRIRSCQLKLNALNGEKEFQEVSRCYLYSGFQAPGVRGYLYEVDILYYILQSLNFEQPEYVTTVDDQGLFIGALLLSLPDNKANNTSGAVTIEASYPETDLSRAKNAAAREAIFYLEKEFNFEVVDYNYAEKLSVDLQLSLLNELDNNVLFLGATANKFWDKLLQRIQFGLYATKDIRNMAMADGVNDPDIQFMNDYIAKLEATHAKCTGVNKIAIEKFSSLE